MSSQNFFRPKNRIAAGVCAGIANSMGYDAVWVRLAWVILTLLTGVIIGVVAYAVLWVVMPES